MAASSTITLVSLTPGTTVIASLTPAAGDTYVTLTIDRTVAGGLNATVGPNIWAFSMEIDWSADGGTTWQMIVAGRQPGIYPSAKPSSSISTGIQAGWLLRATFTVPAGVSSLAVAGSLATS